MSSTDNFLIHLLSQQDTASNLSMQSSSRTTKNALWIEFLLQKTATEVWDATFIEKITWQRFKSTIFLQNLQMYILFKNHDIYNVQF